MTVAPITEEPLRPGTWYRTQLLLALDLIEPGGRILDVGGRDGRFLASLGATNGVLVDVEVAPREDSIRYVCGSGTALPVADGIADTVLALDVIEHVPDERAFVDELLRITRPGGRIVLTTPSHDIRVLPGRAQNVIDKMWGHDRVRGYAVDHLRALFAAASDVDVTSVGMRAYRRSFVPMRAVWSLPGSLGRRIVDATARYDLAHLEGERGFRLLVATR